MKKYLIALIYLLLVQPIMADADEAIRGVQQVLKD